MTTNRRQWIRQSAMATLGLGLSLRGLANEESLPRHFGKSSGFINLGSNENPYGLSPLAQKAVMEAMKEANRYQFNVASLENFRGKMASHFGVEEKNILLTAGSGVALVLLARYFNKGNTVTANPTFGILPNTAKRQGTKLIEVPLTAAQAHDLPALLAATNSETQLVYIVNPANPTGTIVGSRPLMDFCTEASKKAVVLVDEAYIDFVDPPENRSMVSLVGSNPNLLVLRTFSKIHAMAGMRLGVLIGHPDLIKKLEESLFSNMQSTLSNLTMAAAAASLTDSNYLKNCKIKNDAARAYLVKELQAMNYQTYDSHTNFLFFKLKNGMGDFSKTMMDKKILVRSNQYPEGQFSRVSIGTMEEMKQFVEAMRLLTA